MGKLSKKLGPLLSSVHKENVVSSTVILAKLFKTISDSLLNAPDPPNMSPDELALYKQQLGEQALPLEDQARKIVEALASQPNIFHPELSSLRTMRFNLDTPNLIFYPRDWFQILGSNFKLRIPKAYNIPEIKQEVANSQNKLEKALETGL